jgi:hypothetical protein
MITISRLYHNLFFLLIISTAYSAQGVYGFRISDLFLYLIIGLGFFLSYRKQDSSLWLLSSSVIILALMNDFYFFAIQLDYSVFENIHRSIRYDRILLYIKYITFFSLPLALTTLQNNSTYSEDNINQKNTIKNGLVALYFLMIILLTFQYISLKPDRLSFPFSGSNIMWPQKTDGHVLAIVMAFLVAFVQTTFCRAKSTFTKFITIIPGIIVTLLTGSSGGVVILFIFYLLYLKLKTLMKPLLILSVIMGFIFLFVENQIIIEFIKDSPLSRALSVPRLIYENMLTDDINRLTIHFLVLTDLLESGRILHGFGFLGMSHYYYDSFIPSLIAPFGISGLILFFLFMYLVYKKNSPHLIAEKKIFNIFVILFIVAIFISEYHLVVRGYSIMIACLYYFSGSNHLLDQENDLQVEYSQK